MSTIPPEPPKFINKEDTLYVNLDTPEQAKASLQNLFYEFGNGEKVLFYNHNGHYFAIKEKGSPSFWFRQMFSCFFDEVPHYANSEVGKKLAEHFPVQGSFLQSSMMRGPWKRALELQDYQGLDPQLGFPALDARSASPLAGVDELPNGRTALAHGLTSGSSLARVHGAAYGNTVPARGLSRQMPAGRGYGRKPDTQNLQRCSTLLQEIDQALGDGNLPTHVKDECERCRSEAEVLRQLLSAGSKRGGGSKNYKAMIAHIKYDFLAATNETDYKGLADPNGNLLFNLGKNEVLGRLYDYLGDDQIRALNNAGLPNAETLSVYEKWNDDLEGFASVLLSKAEEINVGRRNTAPTAPPEDSPEPNGPSLSKGPSPANGVLQPNGPPQANGALRNSVADATAAFALSEEAENLKNSALISSQDEKHTGEVRQWCQACASRIQSFQQRFGNSEPDERTLERFRLELAGIRFDLLSMTDDAPADAVGDGGQGATAEEVMQMQFGPRLNLQQREAIEEAGLVNFLTMRVYDQWDGDEEFFGVLTAKATEINTRVARIKKRIDAMTRQDRSLEFAEKPVDGSDGVVVQGNAGYLLYRLREVAEDESYSMKMKSLDVVEAELAVYEKTASPRKMRPRGPRGPSGGNVAGANQVPDLFSTPGGPSLSAAVSEASSAASSPRAAASQPLSNYAATAPQAEAAAGRLRSYLTNVSLPDQNTGLRVYPHLVERSPQPTAVYAEAARQLHSFPVGYQEYEDNGERLRGLLVEQADKLITSHDGIGDVIFANQTMPENQLKKLRKAVDSKAVPGPEVGALISATFQRPVIVFEYDQQRKSTRIQQYGFIDYPKNRPIGLATYRVGDGHEFRGVQFDESPAGLMQAAPKAVSAAVAPPKDAEADIALVAQSEINQHFSTTHIDDGSGGFVSPTLLPRRRDAVAAFAEPARQVFGEAIGQDAYANAGKDLQQDLIQYTDGLIRQGDSGFKADLRALRAGLESPGKLGPEYGELLASYLKRPVTIYAYDPQKQFVDAQYFSDPSFASGQPICLAMYPVGDRNEFHGVEMRPSK